jgi:hypothetical protein
MRPRIVSASTFSQRSNRRVAHCFLRAHSIRTHISVDPFVTSTKGEIHALEDLRTAGGRRARRYERRHKAWVLRAERPRTQFVGCEKVEIVYGPTADQDEGENATADAEADA